MDMQPEQVRRPARNTRASRRRPSEILEDYRTADSPVHQVNLALHAPTLALLNALIDEEAERQARTAAAYRRRHRYAEVDGNERAEIRAQILTRARARRAAGELLDTVDAAVTEAVCRELARRAIDPADPPVTPPGASTSGRWPGTSKRGAGERLNALIPRAYWLAVTAAAWQISGPTVIALRSRFPGGRPLNGSPELAEWQGLATHVVTPGDIYREAVERLVGSTP